MPKPPAPLVAALAAVLATLAPLGALADPPGRRDALPRNAVVADLGLHVIGVGFQRTLGPRLAGQLALDLYDPWTQDRDFLGLSGERYTHADVIGGVVRGRFFFYPGAQPLKGGWLSPFGQYGRARADTPSGRHVGGVWAVGLSAGYAWLFGEVFHLAGGLGVQYHASSIPDAEFGRFYPTLDAVAGYAF